MAKQSAYIVHIKSYKFSPATLRVPVGRSVTFVNDDGDAHTVVSKSRGFASNGLDTNDTWTHKFSAPGRYEYLCSLHPYMTGSIVVTQGVRP